MRKEYDNGKLTVHYGEKPDSPTYDGALHFWKATHHDVAGIRYEGYLFVGTVYLGKTTTPLVIHHVPPTNQFPPDGIVCQGNYSYRLVPVEESIGYISLGLSKSAEQLSVIAAGLSAAERLSLFHSPEEIKALMKLAKQP